MKENVKNIILDLEKLKASENTIVEVIIDDKSEPDTEINVV